MNYAILTTAFYAGMQSAYRQKAEASPGMVLFSLMRAVQLVWMGGWREVPDAPYRGNPDAVMELVGINPEDYVTMYCAHIAEGYKAAAGSKADPELIYRAALHHALECIYKEGKVAAENANKRKEL